MQTELTNEMIDDASLTDRIQSAYRFIADETGRDAFDAGIILGSGFGAFADIVEDPIETDYSKIPYMPSCSADSHAGIMVCGMVQGKSVIVMKGRFHGYEGYSSQEIAFPVWVMGKFNIKTLITSNAVGAINPSYDVGSFCLMRDQINFTGRNPIIGKEPAQMAPRFFSMLNAFSPELRAIAKTVAINEGIDLNEGVYLALNGPSFETAAEIEAFSRWGADTVAMSVVDEVIAARHMGIDVLGISLCSNLACGVYGKDPLHDNPIDVVNSAIPEYCKLIRGVLESI